MIPLLSIDIETTGLVWQSTILSVAVSYRENGEIARKSWAVTAHDLFTSGVPVPQVRHELEELIAQSVLVCGHNLSFDYSYLFKYQLLDPLWVWDKTIDTMILARMTASYESVSLFNVAAQQGISDPQWTQMKSKRGTLEHLAVSTVLHYNETDAKYTLLVAEKLLDDAKKIYTDSQIIREGNYAIVCADMRSNGMPVDYTKLDNLVVDYQRRKRFYSTNVLIPERIEGGNDATKIIKFLNKNDFKLTSFTDTGKVSVDEDALIGLLVWFAHTCDLTPTELPDDKNNYSFDTETYVKFDTQQRHIVDVLSAVLASRHYEKALSTWLLPLYDHAKEDGLVHPIYSAGGTVSYRLSCSQPGLQAFPALDIWQPYLNADYSQAEYRMMAMYCHSRKLAEGYARGDDAHNNTAKILFGVNELEKWQRKIGKSFNFAAIYGAGMQKLMASTGFPEKKVLEFKGKLRRELPEINKTTHAVNDAWKERGYIQLWNGVRIYANKYDRENRDYKGFNQLLQGGVAQVIEDAMIAMYKKGIKLLGQIHDSNQFPLDVNTEEIIFIMENALDVRLINQTKPPIPMKVDVEIKGENHASFLLPT